MKLVVVDPICSPIASKADEWIPIRPGTDGALALSMMHVLVNELDVYDRSFLRTQTNAPYLANLLSRHGSHFGRMLRRELSQMFF